MTGLVDEGKAVAAAQGIELDADPEELIDHAARPDVAYDHRASMLQDVEARRRDRDRLAERRDRPVRARARGADAAERGDRGAGERSRAIVVEAERRYGLVREAAEREQVDAVIASGQRVHGLRGRRALPVRLRHRPPLRARAAAARRGAVDRLPRRGALRRRARAVVDRRPGLRGHAGRVAAQALRGARLAARGRLRPRLRDERARLPRALGRLARAGRLRHRVRRGARGQERGGARLRARERPHQRGGHVGDDRRLRAGPHGGRDHGARLGRASSSSAAAAMR